MENILLDPNFFGPKKIWDLAKFGLKKIGVQKRVWVQTILGKKVWLKQDVSPK